MGLLGDLTAFIDNKKRVVARNIWDTLENPADFQAQAAAQLREDLAPLRDLSNPEAAVRLALDMGAGPGMGVVGMTKKVGKIKPTVDNAKRIAYPEIYQRPDALVAEAASRVVPEDPLLKQLFGVSRDDLWQMSEQGTRKGNMEGRPYKTAANPKGAKVAEDVMTRRNANRLVDIIGEAQKYPDLYKGMGAWYVNDPLFDQFKRLYGDKAVSEFNRFNALTGMASPGSEVLTELNRGTAANWLDKGGRFADFLKYGGKAGSGPADMAAVLGHPYHKTAHGSVMSKYLNSGGDLSVMDSAKVPSYIHASGVPETGFQTAYPVGDAHWSRLVGLGDVRGDKTVKGVAALPGDSASVSEMVSLTPWWQKEVAGKAGIESVPAQAIVWGAGSGATGVTSPIGAPKLELLAQKIGQTAQRLNVSPETARDMVLLGKTHAGKVDPTLLPYITGGGLLGVGAYKAFGEE